MEDFLRIRFVIDEIYQAAQKPFTEQMEKKVLDELIAEHSNLQSAPFPDHGYEGTKRYKDESEERFALVCATLSRLRIEQP
jgi:hypothetical protein